MKITRGLATLALSAFAFAQDIQILSPSQNQTVALGQPLTVTISQPFPIPAIPLENVAIVLGVQHCGSIPCTSEDGDEVLGQIILRALFSPALNSSSPFDPPSESFTVVPTGEAGFATVHATAMILTGPGPVAQLFHQNVSVVLSSP